MLNAERHALERRLAQQLMTIRQKEIDYMLGCYSSIGLEAALVAGFAIGTMTNIVNPSNISPGLYFVFLFVSLLSCICCIQCVLGAPLPARSASRIQPPVPHPPLLQCHRVATQSTRGPLALTHTPALPTVSLFVNNWAPRLALLGPKGAVNRAHALMVSEPICPSRSNHALHFPPLPTRPTRPAPSRLQYNERRMVNTSFVWGLIFFSVQSGTLLVTYAPPEHRASL